MKRYLCGAHAVREALAADPRGVALILVTDDSPRAAYAPVIDLARRAGVEVQTRSVAELDGLAKGLRHQDIIGIRGGDYPYFDLDGALGAASDPAVIVALDEITDVHNFGAIVRSCVVFGADAVITLRDRAAPVNAAVVRASAGATEHARIARVTNLARALAQLAERDIVTIGLDASAERTLAETDLTVPLALVVGSEGRGLRRLVRQGCTTLARIPMVGPISSLNASVAAAIALYEVARQRGQSVTR